MPIHAPKDADTIHNAKELWQLVELVQETIRKDGTMPLSVVGVSDRAEAEARRKLAALRKLADEIDPDNGWHS